MSDKINFKFNEIETNRLKLRPINMDDTEAVFSIFSNEALMIPYGMFSLENMAAAVNFTERLIDESEIAICLKEKNTVIGTLGFVDYSKYNNRAEIAFELNEDYWHNGYMYEALKAFIKLSFDDIELNRIEAFVHLENIPSQKLLEKLGFEKEGLLKKRSIQRGNYKDLLIYGLLFERVCQVKCVNLFNLDQ